MIKQGLSDKQINKIEAKIHYLENRLHDNKGLTKEAGGNIRVSIVDWDNEYMYYGVYINEELKHSLHYPLEEFCID